MRILRTASALAMVVALASCNDDGTETVAEEATGSDPTGTGGTDVVTTPVVSTGTITGFGSIYVNGKRFEVLDTTSVEVEGQAPVSGGQSLLKLGQIVKVVGTTSSNGDAEAQTITFDVDLRGIASGFVPDTDDLSIGTFTVIGQRVTVDAFTVIGEDFDDINGDDFVDFQDLDGTASPLGDWFVVEVSGSVTDSGIIATRIDKIEERGGDVAIAGDEYDIKGFVDSVASNASSFTMNAETIFIDGATVFLDSLQANDIQVGDFLEVKVDRDGSGNYIAVEVELIDESDDAPAAVGTGFEVEGIVRSVNTLSTPHSVTIDGLKVRLDDATEFASLVGERIFVAGTFAANNVLTITEFEVEPRNTIGLKDEVASIDTAAGTLTTRLGIVITPTGESRVLDRDGQEGDALLTPAEFVRRLNVGDEVRARAYTDGTGNYVWTQIQRRAESDGTCTLRTEVEAPIISGSSFTMLGITVSTSPMTTFVSEQGQVMAAENFYGALDIGDAVKVDSGPDLATCSTGSIMLSEAGKVSFNDDDGVAANDGDKETEEEEGDESLGDFAIIAGGVSEIDDETGAIVIGSEVITILPETLIAGDVFERAVGGELTFGPDDVRFDGADWPLSQLLLPDIAYEVKVDTNGNAIRIDLAD